MSIVRQDASCRTILFYPAVKIGGILWYNSPRTAIIGLRGGRFGQPYHHFAFAASYKTAKQPVRFTCQMMEIVWYSNFALQII